MNKVPFSVCVVTAVVCLLVGMLIDLTIDDRHVEEKNVSLAVVGNNSVMLHPQLLSPLNKVTLTPVKVGEVPCIVAVYRGYNVDIQCDFVHQSH